MTTKSEIAMKAAADALAAAGFVPDGETASETVRISTRRAPVLGRSGGELRTFGERARWRLPGTKIRATVGPRTTNIYEVVERDVRYLGMHDTARLADIQATLAKHGLKAADAPTA